jgi:glycosyltransferase involved in cell wall biosynthesis
VQLHIRGHGPLKPELEQLVDALNLQTQVKFLGMMTRDELRDLITQSHALVSSSTVETFGVTVAEAMACGRPVVSTRSGGPEDFVTERSGILLPPRDLDALAAALEKMVADYPQFDPPAVREDCVSRFSEDVYVARLEDVYRQALSSHR